MDTTAVRLLESWDKNVRICTNLMSLVTPGNCQTKSSEDGWSMQFHMAHVCETRFYWANQISPEMAAKIGDTFYEKEGEWFPIEDLDEIRRQLEISAQVVRDLTQQHIEAGSERTGPYEHIVFFLQHMLWHDGYHFSLIMLALRHAGIDPGDDWEEPNVWGIWRPFGS